MTTQAPPTQPTADTLLAMVHAYRRGEFERIDTLAAPWLPTIAGAGILVLSVLDLSSRVAAYMGGTVAYRAPGDDDDTGTGRALLHAMADGVAKGDAAAAYGAFILAATEDPNADEWLPTALLGAVAGLDHALRMTPA